jgi:hypothetical protein
MEMIMRKIDGCDFWSSLVRGVVLIGFKDFPSGFIFGRRFFAVFFVVL